MKDKIMETTQKRAFIVRVIGFPRKSAGANYVQYLSKALITAGYKTTVIGYRNNDSNDYCPEANKFEYAGIEYFNVPESTNIVWKKIKYNPNILWVLKKKFSLRKNDIVIIYGLDMLLVCGLNKIIPEDNIYVCQVEDLQAYQFKGKWLNPDFLYGYISKRYVWSSRVKKFPISTQICTKYGSSGRKDFMVLPIMADTSEYNYIPKLGKAKKTIFIYPGMKATVFEDDISLLLLALESLSEEELSRMEIHITGAKKEQIMKRYHFDEKVKNVFIFHGWLSYEELIQLYRKAEFLLLIRKDNDITRANFPSKVPELMSFGVIPVCTEVGDYTRNYLENGIDSIFIKSENMDSVARAIQMSINMNDRDYLLMQEKARMKAINLFDYRNWSDKIDAFINEKKKEEKICNILN